MICFTVFADGRCVPPRRHQNNIRIIEIYIDFRRTFIAGQRAAWNRIMSREFSYTSRNKAVKGFALNSNTVGAFHLVVVITAHIRIITVGIRAPQGDVILAVIT